MENNVYHNFFNFLTDNEKKEIPIHIRLRFNPECLIDLLIKRANGQLYYKTMLKLNRSKIKTLPNNLYIDGSLELAYSQIEYLPDNLTVYGYLSITSTKIKEFPKNLTFKGGLCDLYIGNTPLADKYTDYEIRKLYPDLKYISRNV
jgi:hypothetical protein